MERWKQLGKYQKAVLIFITAMSLMFVIVYSVTIHREGFAYQKSILVPSEENGNTIYSGKIKGEQARFTVSADKIVEFQHGDKIYGPYVVKEDPTILVKDNDISEELLKRLLVYRGKEEIFRGGAYKNDDYWWLYNEDGSLENIGVAYIANDGIERDEDGNVIDPMEPSVSDILNLRYGPALTHKGEWYAWFCGVVVCFVTAISILFADELFRFNMAFQIRDADTAEPSEWQIAGRYISWTILPLMAMIIFIMGLQ